MDANKSLPVDFEAALEQFDGDRDFMLEMFKDYEAGLPQRMEEIRAAFQEGSAENLFRRAHNLKGVSLTFCAKTVSELAAQIEAAGKRGDMSDMPALVAQLDEAAQRLQEYLAKHLPR